MLRNVHPNVDSNTAYKIGILIYLPKLDDLFEYIHQRIDPTQIPHMDCLDL